jgi:hypothetical protein
MLVPALMGVETMQAAYEHANAESCRFYSSRRCDAAVALNARWEDVPGVQREAVETHMVEVRGKSRWSMLPGGGWRTTSDARLWIKRERERLGWTHKDIERSFFDTAVKSDLYIGPGGGPVFDRATVARVRRFEEGGVSIPDWLYWMPLAIDRAAVSIENQEEWERTNIPAHSDLRGEQEEADYLAHTPFLEDDQLELVARYNELAPRLRGVFLQMAGMPELIALVANHVGIEVNP